MLHHESITACGCYRYCHEKCLVAEINKENTNKDELIYQCTVCSKMVDVHFRMDVVTRPHFSKLNMLLILLVLLLLPVATYCAFIYQDDIVKEAINSLIIFILLGFLAIAIVNSFLVREFVAVGVRSTQLGLIISAFLELDKHPDDEQTQTEMVR